MGAPALVRVAAVRGVATDVLAQRPEYRVAIEGDALRWTASAHRRVEATDECDV
jgi:hypothetical protein